MHEWILVWHFVGMIIAIQKQIVLKWSNFFLCSVPVLTSAQSTRGQNLVGNFKNIHSSSPPPFFKGEVDLTKNPKKGGMGKLPKGRGILRRRGFCRKGGDAVSLGIFSSWGVVNVLTFNFILVIVFLFPLNVGVSPCFYCTVLAPVYRVYISCFHNYV